MELRHNQIDRIRRWKRRVDDGTETDPVVIFDVQQLPAVVSEFLRVGESLRKLQARVPDEVEVMEAFAL